MNARTDAAAQGITPTPEERAQRGEEVWRQGQALAQQRNLNAAPNMEPNRQNNA
jgi:hypothetical protein